MLYMPIIPVIQAYYANEDTSTAMHHRDNVLKQTHDIFAKGAGVKKSVSHVMVDHNLQLGQTFRWTAICDYARLSGGAQSVIRSDF